MNIRKANKFDMPIVLEMIKKFQAQKHVTGDLLEPLDFEYLGKLYHHLLLGAGLILVATKDDRLVGMLMAIKNNSVWFPKQVALKEMMIWVEEDCRDMGVGFKLVSEFNSIAEQMIKDKQITQYVMSISDGFGKLNYEKFGYKKVEETWEVKDRQ